MFIELTDHLRCLGEHPEAYLVLLPAKMEGRWVERGVLGCPVCGVEVTVDDGLVDFGAAPRSMGPTELTADAVAALVGIEGPGGYLALVGSVGVLALDLAIQFPGVRFVLINPPEEVGASETTSVLRAPRFPLKAASMRSIVVGECGGGESTWIDSAIDGVLPGNRIVVEGPAVERSDVEVLAQTDTLWVGRRISGPAAGGPARPGGGTR